MNVRFGVIGRINGTRQVNHIYDLLLKVVDYLREIDDTCEVGIEWDLLDNEN